MKTKVVAHMGLLAALAMALSFFESLLPGIPGLPPGIRLGLSNIVVMYCLFFLGSKKALLLSVLKSLFVFFLRGLVACCLSLTGGICSVLVMLLLFRLPGKRISYFIISVAGAVSHNIGQLILASILLTSWFALYYLPVLLISGVAMGAATSALLRALLPFLRRFGDVHKRNG